jgi:hypothetical protein
MKLQGQGVFLFYDSMFFKHRNIIEGPQCSERETRKSVGDATDGRVEVSDTITDKRIVAVGMMRDIVCQV